MKIAVVGVVDTRAAAEEVIQRLGAAGFGPNDISALVPDRDGRGAREFTKEQHAKGPEDPATGTSPDKAIGSGLAILVGIGALAIPGIGPLIGAGPIMAGLGGLALGAVFIGMTSVLANAGVPEYDARRYEEMLRAGKTLIFVHTSDSAAKKRAEDVLDKVGVPYSFSQTEGKARKHAHP